MIEELEPIADPLGMEPSSPEFIALLVGVVLVAAWGIMYMMEEDAGDATDRLTGSIAALVLGLASVIVVVIANASHLIVEGPGFAAALIVTGIGYAGLADLLTIGPELFVWIGAAAIIGALAMREA